MTRSYSTKDKGTKKMPTKKKLQASVKKSQRKRAADFVRHAGDLNYDPKYADLFFDKLKEHGPVALYVYQGNDAKRRLFKACYRVIAGVGEHIASPDFANALRKHGNTPKGGSQDIEILMLRIMIDYEAEARTLEGVEQAKERKNAQKAASRDATAVRYLLSEGVTPFELNERLGRGEGVKMWAGLAPPRRASKKARQSNPSSSINNRSGMQIPDELEGITLEMIPCSNPIEPKRDRIGVLQVGKGGQILGFVSIGILTRFLKEDGSEALKSELARLVEKHSAT